MNKSNFVDAVLLCVVLFVALILWYKVKPALNGHSKKTIIVRFKAVVLLLLTFCLLLLPLWESVTVLCFVVRYFMSILILQSSWWGREIWLLCLICLPGVSWWLSGSSSLYRGVVVSGLWLWYFLIILTYYFQYLLSFNAYQKCCRMLQREHSAILSTFIKLPFVIMICVLSIFEWPLKTCFPVALLVISTFFNFAIISLRKRELLFWFNCIVYLLWCVCLCFALF